jgi:hypothetical protein
MNTTFVEGDLLLYFNEEVVYVVVLDFIDDAYFIVAVNEEDDYFYGRKIKIKNLTEKYFIKLDHVGRINSPFPWIRQSN